MFRTAISRALENQSGKIVTAPIPVQNRNFGLARGRPDIHIVQCGMDVVLPYVF